MQTHVFVCTTQMMFEQQDRDPVGLWRKCGTFCKGLQTKIAGRGFLLQRDTRPVLAVWQRRSDAVQLTLVTNYSVAEGLVVSATVSVNLDLALVTQTRPPRRAFKHSQPHMHKNAHWLWVLFRA